MSTRSELKKPFASEFAPEKRVMSGSHALIPLVAVSLLVAPVTAQSLREYDRLREKMVQEAVGAEWDCKPGKVLLADRGQIAVSPDGRLLYGSNRGHDSIAIFAIGLMAMGALQTSALMGTGNVTRKTEAWASLEEQAEIIKQVPFYQDVNTRTFPPALVDFGCRYAVALANAQYRGIDMRGPGLQRGVGVGDLFGQSRIRSFETR